jgi:hypothetical protein
MYLELASQCAPKSVKIFGVAYNLAIGHPHMRDCIVRSDFQIAEWWKDYSDTEGSDVWRTADSTRSNPHPQWKLQGRLHPMAQPGRKKQRTH